MYHSKDVWGQAVSKTSQRFRTGQDQAEPDQSWICCCFYSCSPGPTEAWGWLSLDTDFFLLLRLIIVLSETRGHLLTHLLTRPSGNSFRFTFKSISRVLPFCLLCHSYHSALRHPIISPLDYCLILLTGLSASTLILPEPIRSTEARMTL